jgi:hypothetical protein
MNLKQKADDLRWAFRRSVVSSVADDPDLGARMSFVWISDLVPDYKPVFLRAS